MCVVVVVVTSGAGDCLSPRTSRVMGDDDDGGGDGGGDGVDDDDDTSYTATPAAASDGVDFMLRVKYIWDCRLRNRFSKLILI